MLHRLLPLLLLVATTALAYPYPEHAPFPESTKVSAYLEKAEYFAGENIRVHFRLKNTGKEPFAFRTRNLFGGPDFYVRVEGPDGNSLPDPFPGTYMLPGKGGCAHGWNNLGDYHVLEPGHSTECLFQLLRCYSLDTAGVYTVHVKHGFGYDDSKEHPFPEVTVRVTIKAPSEAEARAVVADLDTIPPERLRSYGLGPPEDDYATLSAPIYTPILIERAKSPEAKLHDSALVGMSYNPSPEITEALIEMIGDPDPVRAAQAGATFVQRLPASPGLSGYTDAYGVHIRTSWQTRCQQAWQPRFAAPALARGRTLLLSNYNEGVAAGAYLVERFGRAEDLPALLQTLGRIVNNPTHGLRDVLNRGNSQNIRQVEEFAADLYHRTGETAAPLPLETLGGRMLFLRLLEDGRSWRPTGWEEQCGAILDHEGHLQGRVLDFFNGLYPLPPTLALVVGPRLPLFLLSKDESLVLAACHAARRVKVPECHDALFQTLSQHESKERIREEANEAACFQGFRTEILQYWGDRLKRADPPDPGRGFSPLAFMAETLLKHKPDQFTPGQVAASPTPEQAAALRQSWAGFLAAHREEIDAGKQYDPADAEVQPLFPQDLYRFF